MAVRVTGQYYRALSGHRDELASTSYELYTDTSVSHTLLEPHVLPQSSSAEQLCSCSEGRLCTLNRSALLCCQPTA